MTFLELTIKPNYDSVRDDLYDDFFTPVLSNSLECMRIGGNFSSKNFLKIVQGMKNFIINDGLMKLVLLPNFSEDDISAINSGLKKESDVLLENWIKDYDEIDEKFVKDHTKALAWMLKNKFLEIKILKITDLNGNLASKSDLKKISLLEQKIGIFKGHENNEFITFRGNLDYDDENNDYSRITTFRYWDSSEQKYCDDDYETFEKFWEGDEFEYVQNYFFKSISLPLALEENLVQHAPVSKSDLNLERPFTLRKMQKKAIKKWQENNFKGIYEMATGTGKTRTAIGSIKQLEKENIDFVTIIVVPSDPLGIQWKDELKKWGYNTILTMKSNNWKQEISDLILLQNSKKLENLCIITSYTTFANILFQEKLSQSNFKKFLIADEVHHAGSPNAQNGLDVSIYDFRLGLTATLKRYFDDEGTKIIINFFHDVVFRYTMAEAIRDEYLCEYNYHIEQVDLTDDEYVEYRSESFIMAKLFKKIRKDPEAYEKYKRAAERRSNIVKSAFNKLDKLRSIIKKRHDDGEKLDFGLIYCNFDQIHDVQKILNNNKPRPIFNRKITEKNTPTRKQKEEIFQGLLKGDYDVILAIHILDEGWDCPEVKNCILMASTGNEKQYIQRRGRVLRPFKGKYPDESLKEKAEIYDMCVIPDISSSSDDGDVVHMEKTLIENELRRMEIMAESAKNSPDCYDIISKIRQKLLLE